MRDLEEILNELCEFIEEHRLEEKIGEEAIDKLMMNVGSMVMRANRSSRYEVDKALKMFDKYAMRSAEKTGDPMLILLTQIVTGISQGDKHED